MGALVATIGRSELNSSLPHVPVSTRAAIANTLGSGGTLPGQHQSPQILDAARDAFVSALGTGLLVGAIVTLGGALIAWVLIQRRPTTTQPQPAADKRLPEERAPEAVPAEVGAA
jgi:hypothetical protein